MIRKTIGQIASMITVLNDISPYENHQISGVSINTKTLKKGNLFIPLKGEKHDGHEFINHAFEQGAYACLWQKDFPNPPQDRPVLIVEDTLKALQTLAKGIVKIYKSKWSL